MDESLAGSLYNLGSCGFHARDPARIVMSHHADAD